MFQLLRSEGVGAEVEHIPLTTKEEEATTWEKGVLGDLTPQALVRSVIFLNGKNFCLRGLKLSQFVRNKNQIENGSMAF